MDHLVERWRDQPRQADQVGAVLLGGLEDPRGGHHHAEVDDLIVVAAKHDPDDVLPDVVDVALHRGRDDRARSPSRTLALGLEVRHEMGHRLLHHARALHDLREEHPARPEEVADDVHPGHQRTLDDLQRPARRLARLFGVLDDPRVDPLHQRVGQALVDRPLAPGQVLGLAIHPGAVGVASGDLEETLGGVRSAVQDHVFDSLAQVRVDVVVDRQDAGVHDGHVEPGALRVVEEDRVDGLADRIVPAERERDIRHATGRPGAG
jgi:hypothetical protein